jgi:hypothetical protein
MKKTHFLLLIVIISASCIASAAEKKDSVKVRDFLEFGFSVGICNYDMEFLKDIEQTIKESSSNPKTISDFGIRPYYLLEGLFNFTPRVRAGLVLGYHSTSSEINYDKNNTQSGYARMDLTAITAGTEIEYKALDINNIQLWLHGEYGYLGNIVDIGTSEVGSLPDLYANYGKIFETNYLSAQLKLSATRSNFELSFRGGYTFDLATSSDENSYYGRYSYETITDWSGVCFTAMISYKFR